MRKLVVSIALLFLGTVSCSSSSSPPPPVVPVIDDLELPATATQQPTANGPAWAVPFTISFHDDKDVVNQIAYSSSRQASQIYTLDTPAQKAVALPLTFYLIQGYTTGPVQLSFTAISSTGELSDVVTKPITLE